MKTVSVIIPCYNGENVIDRSIKSVYDQECESRIELIVVDDGSTDLSSEKIKKWIQKFEEKENILKYIYQENKGAGAATNTGLKYVTGEYLTLLDADDCFLPESFQRRITFLEEHNDYVGVRTNGWQDKQGKRKIFVFDESEKGSTNLFDGLIGGNFVNWAGSYMIRTNILFEFYPEREIYPSRFGQNMQILLPVAYKNKFGFIDEPLMIYYLQDNSHSQASNKEEQIEKNDRNFYGYYDIYMHMIDIVVEKKEEHEYYANIIKSWKYRHELSKAITAHDEKKMKEYFEKYKITGRMTLNEQIEYYSVISPIKAVVLKIYRRCITKSIKKERKI